MSRSRLDRIVYANPFAWLAMIHEEGFRARRGTLRGSCASWASAIAPVSGSFSPRADLLWISYSARPPMFDTGPTPPSGTVWTKRWGARLMKSC